MRVALTLTSTKDISDITMEDVHRAGGIMGLLGELDRAGLIHRHTKTVLGMTLEEQLNQYDIIRNQDEALHKFLEFFWEEQI